MMMPKIKEQKLSRHMSFLMEVYEKTRDTFSHVAMSKIAKKHSVQSIAVLVMIENKLVEVDNMEARRYRKYKWVPSIPPNVHSAQKLIDLIDRKFAFYKDKQVEVDSAPDPCIKYDDRQFPRTNGFATASDRGVYIEMALTLAGIAIDKEVLEYLDDFTYLIDKNNGDVTLREITSLSSFKKLQLAGVKLPGTNQIQ